MPYPSDRLLTALLVMVVLAACATAEPLPSPALSGPTPDALALSARAGETATGLITFGNEGGSALSFTLRADQAWLSAEPGSGLVNPGQTQGITLGAACLAKGRYEAALTVASNDPADAGKAVAVTLLCTEPDLPQLPRDAWSRFEPGGDTVCANGSPYAYYAYGGEVNRLVIDFQGGGACWDDATCARPLEPGVGQGLYIGGVYGSPEDYYGSGGIYDKSNEANPLRGWYHVHVNYCTGDIHLGDAASSYTDPATGAAFGVEHRGAVNARSVLEWVFEAFEAPETIVVTGCSAGAYGAIAYTPAIIERYPGAKVYALGDCGAGIVTESFMAEGITRWNVGGAFLPGFSPTLETDFLSNLYAAVGNAYKESLVAQYNTLADGVQIGYYGLMKGVSPPTLEVALEWISAMLASLGKIEVSTANFYAYTADYGRDAFGATPHCIITRDDLYTVAQNGVSFVGWLSDMVSGKAIETVTAPLVFLSEGAPR
ncbi:MAG: pectin acetylesterase-family hydrolase [Deinococcota bacterium]|nr:pectin acetylesterase-family hydrolase [Deinococcota bacterium]